MSDAATESDVIVIGAGFGGLLAALELKRTGRTFRVLERAEGLGGVWRDNVYPGCACDIRSQLYSLERRPSPDWTTNYASQAEILAYLEAVARRDGIGAHSTFGADVCEVRFLEDAGRWVVEDRVGRSWRARSVILATGPHSRPHVPAFPGQDRFGGPSFHSSQWDASVDLRGKRVAVIGSAASAVQILPTIADTVAQVTLFQRSANWVIPRGQRPLSALERWAFRHAPASQVLVREAIYWIMEFVALAILRKEPVAGALTRVARSNLQKVRDPGLRARLTPDFPIGCKRVLVSDDYYPAFNRQNVELVTDEIAGVTLDGLRTRDGRHRAFDVLVWATGFCVADPDGLPEVIGRDARQLTAEWREHGMQGYRGVHVSGFPNFTLLLGPNSGPANSSALHVMESQMRYIDRFLDALAREPAAAALDVRAQVQRVYNDEIQRRLAPTSWNAGCTSWYIDRNGRNTTMFPGLTSEYRSLMSRFDRSDYEVVPPATSQSRTVRPSPGVASA